MRLNFVYARYCLTCIYFVQYQNQSAWKYLVRWREGKETMTMLLRCHAEFTRSGKGINVSAYHSALRLPLITTPLRSVSRESDTGNSLCTITIALEMARFPPGSAFRLDYA